MGADELIRGQAENLHSLLGADVRVEVLQLRAARRMIWPRSGCDAWWSQWEIHGSQYWGVEVFYVGLRLHFVGCVCRA